jgi:hypothetical protein
VATILLNSWLLLALSYSSKPIEEVYFNVLHKGDYIGELKASKTVDGDFITYTNTTNLKARVIMEMQVKFKIQSIYKNNLLESSKVDISLNGKPYSNNSTKKVGNSYEFYKDGKLKSTINGPIKYSATLMLFAEPKGITSAYSEESGGFHTIQKSVANVYEKQNARGRKSIYHYRDQMLNSLDMDLGLTEIEMILKE